jgi:Ca2+-binding RTX toxin-like protein
VPTTSNDTISGGALITDIDGLAGDDLLVVSYPGTVGGFSTYRIELRLTGPQPSRLGHWDTSTFTWVWQEFTVSNIERLRFTGFSGNSFTVYGGTASDSLTGGAGNDGLVGGGGGDVIFGRDGEDVLRGTRGSGADAIYGGNHNDIILDADLTDTVDGGAGIDRLVLTLAGEPAVNANLSQLIESPTWTGIEQFEITLTSGNDTLRVGDQDVTLRGGGGQDLLILDRTGLGAIDRVQLRDLLPGFERVIVKGSDHDDQINGTRGDDTLNGSAGNDTIGGLGGNDLLVGGNGNDILSGIGLTDTVYGGAGIDTAIVDLSGATTGGAFGSGRTWGNLSGVEILSGTLTQGNDTLYGGAQRQDIHGGGGFDTIYLDYSGVANAQNSTMNLGNLAAQTIWIDFYPISYADFSPRLSGWEVFSITGSVGNDSILAGAGNDSLRGHLGNDILTGRAGDDLLAGGDGNDLLTGGDGLDLLYGGNGNDALRGDGANDVLYGGNGDDGLSGWVPGLWAYGGTGSDYLEFDLATLDQGVTLDSRPGAETYASIERLYGWLTSHDDEFVASATPFGVDGGGGDDLLTLDLAAISGANRLLLQDRSLEIWRSGAPGPVQSTFDGFERLWVSGAAGNDTVHGLSGDDTMAGQGGDDDLFGGWGNDQLLGGDGHDLMSGDLGNDTLDGGAGDDLLIGGAGDDLLLGRAGADLFRFEGFFAAGADTIIGFSASEDALWLPGVDPLTVSLHIEGSDLVVDWGNGQAILAGAAGSTPEILYGFDLP